MSPPGAARRLLGVAGLAGMTALGCGQGSGQAPSPDAAPRAQLLKPEVCGSCHQEIYADWAVSMHAYAADDPVFRAMNARGQRETDGGLGAFCVNCHAPMAVREGKTTDGLNLDSLSSSYRGVTCFFCHTISSVDGAHNAAVTTSSDLVMRGEYESPVPNRAHQSAYSPLHDFNHAGSAALCGACHDIVTPAGAHIERTFAEWNASAFSSPEGGNTCGASGCHMVQQTGTPIVQNFPGAPKRVVHRHDFPAVDVPLVAGDAGADAASPLVASVLTKLADSLTGLVCVTQAGGIRVILDAVALGHSFPSGASQDRRLWIEVNAYRGADPTPYYSSGHVAAGASPLDVQSGPDPDRWVLRDCMFGADGGPVSMFWQATGTTDDNALPAIGAFLPDPQAYLSHVEQFFPRQPAPGPLPDRVTLNVWLQPVGLDVLNDLVASHDLDPGIVAAMPTFPVAFGYLPDGTPQQQLVWTAQAAADAGIPQFVDAKDNHIVSCVGTMAQPAPHPAPEHTRCSP